MMKEVDARGLACPAPVLMTKEAIEHEFPEQISVWVDNPAAGENVSRFMKSQSYEAVVEQQGEGLRVIGRKSAKPAAGEDPAADSDRDRQNIMIMVTTDRMGYGDDQLGLKLMVNFLKTVREMGSDLWRLVFVNNGVKLTIEAAETLPALQALEADGVTILVCGTCLDHFGLLPQKRVGLTTNMLDIVMAMQYAEKVISL
jgi:selenium metabolism protein YedF